MYAITATTIPPNIITGIYHILTIQFRKFENARVKGGNFAVEPKLSNTPCIIGTDIIVPITANNINATNCTKFGINISFSFLFMAAVFSRYFTACSNAFVREPDNSPTLIIFIYIGGNTEP